MKQDQTIVDELLKSPTDDNPLNFNLPKDLTDSEMYIHKEEPQLEIYKGKYKDGPVQREFYFRAESLKDANNLIDDYIIYLKKVNNQFGKNFIRVGTAAMFCTDIKGLIERHEEIVAKERGKEKEIA